MDFQSLREEVREQNLALRAELVRQSQRITALEQANRSAPPASGEKEPCVDTSVAPADKVLDVAQEAPKDTPDVAEESEVYEFQESVWDAQLFVFSKFLGKPDSILIVIYAVVNIVVQAVFAAVVFEIYTEPITEASVKELGHWRIVEGHHVTWYDGPTNTSLVRRVCNSFGANLVAGPQQSSIDNFAKYLAEGKMSSLFMRQGPCLCNLGIFLWAATVLVDLWQVEHFAFALIALFSRSKGRRSHISVTSGGSYCMDQISTTRFVLSFLLIVGPRLAIDIGVLWAGVRFLAYENTLSGLILNAVALSFVLSLDELLFLLLPRNTQKFMQNAEPVAKTSRGVTKPGSLDWRSVGMLCACVGILLCAWFAILGPRIDMMDEGYRLLCRGNLDFIYTGDPGTAYVSVADTASTINLPRGTYTASAVVDYIGLPKTGPVLSDYLGIAGPGLYMGESADQVNTRFNLPSQQVLADMPCEDQDTTVGHARALYEKYFEEVTTEVLPGSFCAWIADTMRCTAKTSKSFARALCPQTCGCNSTSLYDRESCTARCNRHVEALRDEQSKECADVTYQNAGPEVKAFFRNVLDDLVASGSLEVKSDFRTQLSSAVHDRFQAAANYEYAFSTQTYFIMSSNVSKWANGGWEWAGNYLDGPCRLLPFYLNIFQKDLCKPGVGLSTGTAMGFCPVVCGYETCYRHTNDMILDIPALYEQMTSRNVMNSLGFFQRILMCDQVQEVSQQESYLIDQIAWGSGDFTIDLCLNGSHFNSSHMGVSHYVAAAARDLEQVFAPQAMYGQCLGNFSLHVYNRTRYMLQFSATQTRFPVRLSCHQDGMLSCDTSLNVNTAGAANLRGRPSPERIYGLDVPIGRMLTLTACGEDQFEPQIDMYWYAPDGQGGPLETQDQVSSAACGGTSLARIMTRMISPPNGFFAITVEGVGNSTGNFTLNATCSFPLLSCGDHVRGSPQELDQPSTSYTMGDITYRFISSNAAVNVSFDTCKGSEPQLDTDLFLYDWNMTRVAYNYSFDQERCRYAARINRTIPPNTEVYLRLKVYGEGEYHLNVTCA